MKAEKVVNVTQEKLINIKKNCKIKMACNSDDFV